MSEMAKTSQKPFIFRKSSFWQDFAISDTQWLHHQGKGTSGWWNYGDESGTGCSMNSWWTQCKQHCKENLLNCCQLTCSHVSITWVALKAHLDAQWLCMMHSHCAPQVKLESHLRLLHVNWQQLSKFSLQCNSLLLGQRGDLWVAQKAWYAFTNGWH
jgi:hypothetical protein